MSTPQSLHLQGLILNLSVQSLTNISQIRVSCCSTMWTRLRRSLTGKVTLLRASHAVMRADWLTPCRYSFNIGMMPCLPPALANAFWHRPGKLPKGSCTCFYEDCRKPSHAYAWDHCPELAMHVAESAAVILSNHSQSLLPFCISNLLQLDSLLVTID